MNFDPSSIWSWYQRRPTWLKVFLFIFVALVIVFAAVVAYLMRGRILSGIVGNGPDPLQTGKDATEEHFWRKYQAAKEIDTKAAGRIANEQDERIKREKERKDAATKNQDDHANIDAADNIADVDAALRDGRKR